jgi:hypothetical protein
MILCPDDDGDEDVGAVLILPSSLSVSCCSWPPEAQNLGKHPFFLSGKAQGQMGAPLEVSSGSPIAFSKQKEKNNHRKKQARQPWMDIPLTKAE